MGFATPLGLLALLAVPAVLWLHKLRRRLVERRVAGLFLFAPDALSAEAGRTISPLLRTASLAIELAAAAVFALLLGGLRFGGTSRAPHVVLVLDGGASMGAVVDGSSSADRARDLARARLAELPGDGLATVIVTGRSPELLAGPRVPAGIARAALDRYDPRRPSHDASAALDLGLELASGEDALWFLTDRGGADANPRYAVESVGRRAANAALANVRRLAKADDEDLYVDVIGYGAAPWRTEVRVAVGEGVAAREVARKEVALEPGRPSRLSMRLPRSDLPLRVTLASDALAVDDVAVLLADPTHVVPYSVELPPETVASLGLERLPRVLPAVVRVEPDAAPALRFHADPTRAPSGTTDVVISAPGAERDPWVGPFLLERRHPLLEGIALDGVVWSAGRGDLPGRGLVFAGDQALLAEDRPEGGLVVRLNLDVGKSNLAASPDWPILLANLFDRARASGPGQGPKNVRMDETMDMRLPAAQATAGWKWVDPDGAEEPVHGRGLLSLEPRLPGTHRLVAPAQEVARWSVQFVDGRTSDLAGCVTSSRSATKAPTGPRARSRLEAEAGAVGTVGRTLAVLLLLLAVADAWVLSRGRRAPGTAAA